MRILHLVLAPRLSGAEVLAKDLAIHQQRSGETVCVSSLMPQHDDFALLRAELEANAVTCVFPTKLHGAPGKLWHLDRTVRRFRPDVIFAHSTIPALYARALPTVVPVVYVMHSAANDFDNGLLRRAERVLSRRARAVIAVSPANVDDYIGAIGKHPSMMVIPNGVDMARFGDAAHAHGGPRQTQPTIVQIGRYTTVKNQLQTVQAFADVARWIPAARLLLYGVVEDAAYYRAVSERVNALGLADRVVVGGPRSDVSHILFDATVYAMPSKSEGHSIAFLEALASGIPVVASAIRPFAFAADFASVQLIDTDDTQAYTQALVVALSQSRAQRPLAGLTLKDTADRYLAVAHQVIQARAA
jgi:glycosyltransferase involved in cell wall biosynthesis